MNFLSLISDGSILSGKAGSGCSGLRGSIISGFSTKLTRIDSSGIYTGTLTAGQINVAGIDAINITAGTLSVDRIAAGSITADKLNVSSLQASIVTAAYIEGLDLNFTKGKIGGWNIGPDSISSTLIGVGQTPVQIRSSAAGSGFWYTGDYRPMGVTLTWHQTNNVGHIILGEIAASGSSVKPGFVGLQMMSQDGHEYFCLSANTQLSGSKEVYNRIAGWAFDGSRIWKNNVILGEDGSIANGTKWKLNNDGSGQIANGNIIWDSAGTVTFSSAVSLNWSNSTSKGKLYVRGTGLNHSASAKVTLNGTIILETWSRGLTLTIIDRYTCSLISNTNYDVYTSDVNCNAGGASKSMLL